MYWQHFQAVSGAFMDSPYNGNTSLQTSTSNLNASCSRPSEAEDDGKVSSDTIWLWIAVLATIGNIVVVAVVCVCAFWHLQLNRDLVQFKNTHFSGLFQSRCYEIALCIILHGILHIGHFVIHLYKLWVFLNSSLFLTLLFKHDLR